MSKECQNCNGAAKPDYEQINADLRSEVDSLKASLREKNKEILKMEASFFLERQNTPAGDMACMRQELRMWEEKYKRLLDLQRETNSKAQRLEDNQLNVVEKCADEREVLVTDIQQLSCKLADVNDKINELTRHNAVYHEDVMRAVELLQCKPSNFVGQRYDSLPNDLQAKVKSYYDQQRHSSKACSPEPRKMSMPMNTYPPSAMVFNGDSTISFEKKNEDQCDDGLTPLSVITADIMAKALAERALERKFAKHCDSCSCNRGTHMVDSESQTAQVSADETYAKPSSNGYSSLRQGSPNSPSTSGVQAPAKLERPPKSIATKIKSKKSENSEVKSPAILPMSTRRSTPRQDLALDLANANAISVEAGNETGWRNGWNKNSNGTEERVPRPDAQFEVINERVWKKAENPPKVTMIEVNNSVNLNEAGLPSPCFSSDSSALLISSSEPSSSSSDLVKSDRSNTANLPSDRRIFANGARKCLMRVAQTSKNILLDNAHRNYQPVVYSSTDSGSGSPNASYLSNTTALVDNNPATSRLSTSSDEACAILPCDSPTENSFHSARRLAEWVHSSRAKDQSTPLPQGSRQAEHRTSTMPPFESTNGIEGAEGPSLTTKADPRNDSSDGSSNSLDRSEVPRKSQERQVKDLISFDSNNEEETEEMKADGDYQEIKITKEMEETYLKLAASLDPVTLSLSSSGNPDITIENYRKDHKKVQGNKGLDKNGPST